MIRSMRWLTILVAVMAVMIIWTTMGAAAQQPELLPVVEEEPEPPAMLPAVTDGLVAWYPLNDGEGRVARDRSGEDVAPNLLVTPETAWEEDGPGLTFDNDQARAYSEEPPRQLIERLAESKAFSFEVWLAPDGLEQGGPARIVTISDGTSRRNITIGHGEHRQPGPDLYLRLRTTRTDANGMPNIVAPDTIIEQPAQYVVTYTENLLVTVYRDGKLVYRGAREGSLNWDTGYQLAFGAEPDGERNWRGRLYRVGIYDRELTAEEVERNYKHWTTDEEPEEEE